jgi:quercetin dioxygenase-like cupin family protein
MGHTKFLVAAAAVSALGMGALYAQQAGFSRVAIQDKDLSIPSRHVVVARAEFADGGVAAPHTHPGEEVGYVLEGTLQLEIAGQPPVTVKAGEGFFVPANTVHGGRTVGGPAKVLATYIVEKGKPVATPVK